MNEGKYATRERAREAADTAPAERPAVRKVIARCFPKSELFARLHPEYRSFSQINPAYRN